MVKQYIQQSILEKELLYFGYEAFGLTFVDPVSKQNSSYFNHSSGYLEIFWSNFLLFFFSFKDTWTPENVMPKKLRDKQK